MPVTLSNIKWRQSLRLAEVITIEPENEVRSACALGELAFRYNACGRASLRPRRRRPGQSRRADECARA
jgi:hypothetical protein